MTDRQRELPPIEPLPAEPLGLLELLPVEPLEPLDPLEPLPIELDPLGAPGVIVAFGALIDAPLDPVFDAPTDPVFPAAPLSAPEPPPTDPAEPGTEPAPPPCANTGAAAINTVPIVYSKNLFIELLLCWVIATRMGTADARARLPR